MLNRTKCTASTMNLFLVLAGLTYAWLWLTTNALAAEADNSQPNVIVIFIDDMGYADIGPFGADGYSTPHLNRMARDGMRFTDFVVSSAVC